jgi:hypothetical protein
VPTSEIVKEYELEQCRYVVLSDQDFDKVQPESTRVIGLVPFADGSAIEPVSSCGSENARAEHILSSNLAQTLEPQRLSRPAICGASAGAQRWGRPSRFTT